MGVFGTKRAASPIIGALCLATTYLAGGLHWRYISRPAMFFGAFVASYVGIGFTTGLVGNAANAVSRLTEVIIGFSIVFSAMVGVASLRRNGREARILRMLGWITFLSILTIPVFKFALNDFFLYTNLDETGMLKERSAGVFANPNEAGLLAGLGLTIVLSGVFAGWRQYVLGFALVSTAFLVFSRAAILACAAVAIVVSVTRLRRPETIVSALGMIVLMILLQYIAPTYIVGKGLLTADQEWRLQSLGDLSMGRTDVDGIDSGRMQLAVESLKAIASAPLVGYGIGGALVVLQGSGSHNQFLSIALEAGIPVMLVFLLFIGVTLYSSLVIRINEFKTFLLGLMAWFIIAAFFSHNLLDLRFVSLYVGVALGLCSPVTFNLNRFIPNKEIGLRKP